MRERNKVVFFLQKFRRLNDKTPAGLTLFVFLCAGWSFSMGSAYQFHSWRVFVVVCALPCVSAVVALTFMPESPRFYLEVRDSVVPPNDCGGIMGIRGY